LATDSYTSKISNTGAAAAGIRTIILTASDTKNCGNRKNTDCFKMD